MTRPSWDEYGLGIAKAVSVRGDCTRRQVGAVILDKDHRIVGGGYNGTVAGRPGCLEGACPRGRHYKAGWHGNFNCSSVCKYPRDQTLWNHCGCGERWPCPEAVEPSSSYDTGPGRCIAVHAEANALLDADPLRRIGATLYISEVPCDGCKKIIAASGIARVVAPEYEWVVNGTQAQ